MRVDRASALTLSGVFVMLLLSHYVVAALFAGLAGLVVAAWHTREPQES